MFKINIVSDNHKLFQQRLNRLADPPKTIYSIGKLPDSDTPTASIVGSRKPTSYGREITYQLAYDLAKQGVVIVSGLAIGVDGVAHQAALDAKGVTVAVLGGGLDSLHPLRHRKLAQQIVEVGGCLVSEYPEGIVSWPGQFVARNRIIAAFGDGVIVTEAAERSGSLHTANFALDLGLQVMAAPGLATNPMAKGSLNLLKAGATLVTGAADVLFALGYHQATMTTQTSLLGDSPQEERILHLLAEGVCNGEELLAQSGLQPSLFNQSLTMLEINGKIKALGGNQWIVAPR